MSVGRTGMTMLRQPVYLDAHATTPLDPRVFEAMRPWYTERFGNASSGSHAYGWEAAKAVQLAREEVARLVNVSADEVIFTSGGTESNNLALKGLFRLGRLAGQLVTNVAEHQAVLDPARWLKRRGVDVRMLPVDECGRVPTGLLARQLTSETVCVSVMWANNEVGTVNDLAEISRLCRERLITLHCDAVQMLGKLSVDLSQVPVDLVSVSAHKLYGPQGVGALIVRRGQHSRRLEPLLEGGGQEQHLRSGTLPVALIVGFGAACAIARAEMIDEAVRLQVLRDRLWQGLRAGVADLVRNGDPRNALPGNLNVSVPGVDGDRLLTALTDVAVSSGSACSSLSREPSHVLRAMGRDEQLARASLRFGLSRFTTSADIDFAIDYVSGVIQRLRS